ncbi:MAG: YjjG family noncanonical pyrimidine nucleotidase [Paludibacter sp.]
MKSTENSIKTAGNSAPSAGKSYKAVFIDLDDTIWDFHTNAELALKDMYDERGLDKHFTDFDQFFSIYAKRNIELWEQYGKGEVTKEFLMMERFRYPLAKMGIDDEEMAVEIGNQYLDNLPGKKTLMPFAIELLDYLKAKNYPITLISNGFTEVQHRKLQSSGIAHYFDHIVLSESAGALKPDKQIFEYALMLNGVSASEAIMIGDSYDADIKGAINANIDQVYYPLHYPVNGEKPACTYMIKSLKEVMELL